MKAKIFDIERCSFHDGEGIRTVVYMKGCTLRCQWCHNPEGIFPGTEILFHKSRCIRCGRCVEACPAHHIVLGDEMVYIRDDCSACMNCMTLCPTGALSACGKDMTPEQVFAEIIKDKHYYDASGGGVTFSGGECLLYPDFLLELAKMCKDAGIHIAVESALNIGWNHIDAIRNVVDTFIVDIKHDDSEMHKKWTGHGNQLILENMERLSHLHPSIWVRIPLIPDANDDDINLIGTSKRINTFGSGIKVIELLKYNNLAGNKYAALGKEPVLFANGPQDDSFMEQKCGMIREHVRSAIQVICG